MADRIERPTSAPTGEGILTPAWVSWLNWVHALVSAMRQSGTTAERPTAGLWIGRQYYDTTLMYPVYVYSLGPIVWKNAAGVTV